LITLPLQLLPIADVTRALSQFGYAPEVDLSDGAGPPKAPWMTESGSKPDSVSALFPTDVRD
jgi:hypothetical protein